MRVLLDECLPRRLKDSIVGHEVVTVQEAGWSGALNGELLARARSRFDVFVTVDRGVPEQQNLRDGPGVLILRSRSNRLDDLLPLVPAILRALESIERGEIVFVGAESRPHDR